jgi:cytochrome c556
MTGRWSALRSRAAIVAILLGALAGCQKSAEPDANAVAPKAAAAGPGITIQEFMEQQINPAGEYAFRSVRDVADAKGRRLEQPHSEAEWKSVEARLEILRDAPKVLTASGLKVAPPGFKSENPSVESEPAAIQAAIDGNREDFNLRAYRLQISAAETLMAAKARDPAGMVRMLEGVDRACESCHLRYFYPGDQRAQRAAKDSYILN